MPRMGNLPITKTLQALHFRHFSEKPSDPDPVSSMQQRSYSSRILPCK